MTTIPKNHPRYTSLMIREKLSNGFREGLVHETGLIAHGRGEAFDYLLGEKTIPIADESAKISAALLLKSKHPVISVNGNVVALTVDECISLAKSIPAVIEVNLFHRSDDRMRKLVEKLIDHGAETVYGLNADQRIPNLDHDRGWCEQDGIYSADTVLVPLEDGDRCEALQKMGKKVITIDLNPLSRTARRADITIVDNVTRAIKNIEKWVYKLKNNEKHELDDIIKSWDNKAKLKEVIDFISDRLENIYEEEERKL